MQFPHAVCGEICRMLFVTHGTRCGIRIVHSFVVTHVTLRAEIFAHQSFRMGGGRRVQAVFGETPLH